MTYGSPIRFAPAVSAVTDLAGLAAHPEHKPGNDYTKSVARPYEHVLAAITAAAQTGFSGS